MFNAIMEVSIELGGTISGVKSLELMKIIKRAFNTKNILNPGKIFEIEESLSEARRCMWCGFCEFVCPTYNVLRKRQYEPIGRLAMLLKVNEHGLSSALFISIFSCLLCGACKCSVSRRLRCHQRD